MQLEIKFLRFEDSRHGWFVFRRLARDLDRWLDSCPTRLFGDGDHPNTTFEGLAGVLTLQFGSPTVDETRVSGRYEVLLEISTPAIDPGSPRATPEELVDRQLTAYRDALLKAGLRLESRKAAISTLVVDHAEKKHG